MYFPHLSRRSALAAALVLAAHLAAASSSAALPNHPVYVEGNNGAGPGVTSVAPGTAGDFDGDGLIGTAEDMDNSTDRVFGTLTFALGALNNAGNQNARIVIVTSGRFAEPLAITGANGNVTLEAAPGVEATLDAVLSGDPGNVARQGQPGIVVDAPDVRVVVLRNLVVRNWTTGIQVLGSSRVTIDGCRLENNRDYGIRVRDSAQAAITRCQVNATGFRVGSAPDNAPQPGIGIEFDDQSAGVVSQTAITHSYADGFSDESRRSIRRRDVTEFDNDRDG